MTKFIVKYVRAIGSYPLYVSRGIFGVDNLKEAKRFDTYEDAVLAVANYALDPNVPRTGFEILPEPVKKDVFVIVGDFLHGGGTTPIKYYIGYNPDKITLSGFTRPKDAIKFDTVWDAYDFYPRLKKGLHLFHDIKKWSNFRVKKVQ